MSSLIELRTALSSTIEAGVSTELFSYDHVPDVAQLPAIVVLPDKSDFTGAMQRGMDTYTFKVFVLVARTDSETNQEQLDAFLTGGGADSIRQVIYNTPTLGLDDTDAFAQGINGYGGEFELARVPHTGAILEVVVRTDGAT